MMNKEWFTAIFILLAISCFASNELKTVQVEQIRSETYQFVESLYYNYQIKDSIFNFKGPAADTIFCSELLQLIRLDEKLAQGEVGYLEGDPLCFCQDDEGLIVKNIRIEEISCETSAYVDLKISKQQVKIILILDNIKGRSCIADIKTEKTPSLYKFLFKRLFEDVMKSEFK